MPKGKSTASVQAYITLDTKAKIVKQAKLIGESESKIAGRILDKAFGKTNIDKEVFSKNHDSQTEKMKNIANIRGDYSKFENNSSH